MHREARERIIALEVMKLERRQAEERERAAHEEQSRPANVQPARACEKARASGAGE